MRTSVLGKMQGLDFRVMRLRLRAWALGFQGQGFLVSWFRALSWLWELNRRVQAGRV